MAEEVRDGKGRETERQNSFTPRKEKKGHAVKDKQDRKVLKGFQRGKDAELRGGGQKNGHFHTRKRVRKRWRGGGKDRREDGGSQNDSADVCEAAGRQ